MAAGSSAPELATVIIGVFFAKDDIGISGVIGSAVFNIMFVISVCALCSGTVLQLNWWPLVRDCAFYTISILVMLIVIFNDVISWIESLIMLLFYVVYCVALHFNTPLEKWAHTWNLPIKLPTKEEQSALVTYKNLPETTYTQGQQPGQEQPQQQQPPADQPPAVDQGYAAYMDPNASWDPNAAWGEPTPAVTNSSVANVNDAWNNGSGQQNYAYEDQYGQETQKPPQQQQVVQQTAAPAPAPGEDYYKPKEPRPQDSHNPLEKPVDGGILAQVSWAIVYPIHYTARLTMPDCKTEKYKNWYPFTFLISMIWISFYSYFMVWMITIIGSTLGIPDTVMGLTFVAAGVSVPDALSSIAVIKEGYGDMAVSNAVGSNVFDILICLGLPWFIQTAIIKPGSHVNVISKGLTYSTLSLLSTVLFLLFATHLNGWKLDKRLGIVLMFWYLLFITVASLYELNFFGQLNPPECPSIY
ncbi:probable sodium/potassium/calcium exchanger CG1090 [Anopheles moucheti]|uniref:probable sodium/potassium/calcium exchanger CG1090 n=1 Tax=Anopheles moucheti TaxID=186751 RepID=UPI0022F0089B|nr:probable sodium/potassium/calcium exchanger CG1090 [Anopheles moucheti]